MKTHELKVWPEFFAALESGAKTFEVRKDDRGFQVGEGLTLREYDPDTDRLTGRECRRRVTYVLKGGAFGLAAGFVVLGLDQDAAEARGYARAKEQAAGLVQDVIVRWAPENRRALGVVLTGIRAMQDTGGETKAETCSNYEGVQPETCATHAAPSTTAEAFATVRAWVEDKTHRCPESWRSATNALSLLERRMGAMARALHNACPQCHGAMEYWPTCSHCGDSTTDHVCPDKRACDHTIHVTALTDAPPAAKGEGQS